MDEKTKILRQHIFYEAPLFFPGFVVYNYKTEKKDQGLWYFSDHADIQKVEC